jgi:phosphopantothenoylcysteine decarboxylase/phosphopantothenate--cysteine ligase
MPGIQLISVTTAAEMYEACMQHTNADVIVMAAAVADFAPSEPVAHKIKKTTQHTALPLTPTIDILSALSKNRRNVAFLAGFALETDNEEENALQKLRSKNLDMIILNSLSNEGAGFGVDTNVVSIFTRNGESFHLPKC